MSATSSPFKMDFVYPHVLHDYVADDRRHCTVDFLVPTMAKNLFCPSVNVAKQSLDLLTVVPGFFANKQRLMAAFAAETGFGENTHRATAMGEFVMTLRSNTKMPRPTKQSSLEHHNM